MEILENGHLRKLDHISDSVPVLELFSNIWGAGTKTAQMWYHQVMPARLPLKVLLLQSLCPHPFLFTCRNLGPSVFPPWALMGVKSNYKDARVHIGPPPVPRTAM